MTSDTRVYRRRYQQQFHQRNTAAGRCRCGRERLPDQKWCKACKGYAVRYRIKGYPEENDE